MFLVLYYRMASGLLGGIRNIEVSTFPSRPSACLIWPSRHHRQNRRPFLAFGGFPPFFAVGVLCGTEIKFFSGGPDCQCTSQAGTPACAIYRRKMSENIEVIIHILQLLSTLKSYFEKYYSEQTLFCATFWSFVSDADRSLFHAKSR